MSFLTNYTTVWINKNTLNTDPNSKSFEQVVKLASFPEVGTTTQVATIEAYNSTYLAKEVGDMAYNDVTITVNWVPSEHQFLDDLVSSGEEVQMKIEMPDDGADDTTVPYAMYNGVLTSTSTAGSYDTVVTKTYTFAPTALVSSGILDETTVPLNRGDYGVGSNGTTFPSWQERDGNGFIKIPSSTSPTGTDVLGINNLDANFGTQLVISKTGTPIINVRNYGSSMGAWYKVYTSADKPTLTELGAASSASLDNYVLKTQTVNGKQLTGNITLVAADISDVYSQTYITNTFVPKVFQLNGHALSGTSLNLVAADILDVYSQTQTNTNFVAKTQTINGVALSGNITLGASQLTDMASLTYSNSTFVPKTFLVNNKALTGTNINLVAADISDVYSRTQSNDLFALRITRINGYALNSDITLTYDDVGTYSKKQIDDKDKALQANIDTKVTIVDDLLALNTLTGTSLEIDLSDSKTAFTVTLSAGTTNFTIVNASGNTKNTQSFTVAMKQGTGANKISWPDSILWSYGRVPVLTFTKDSTDVFQFVSYDGGSTWFGSLLMADLH
ncbi:hypothetical protein [Enterobacter hormaechei]|uniref:hypothetical protein n=1 Tax=Enterobacter hormaechei TaxID=158836 RepID=UPI002FE5B768